MNIAHPDRVSQLRVVRQTGDDFLGLYLQIMRPDRVALEDALRRYRIAWTLLPPSSPSVALLDLMPGWRRAYADDVAVIHVRAGAAGD